MLKANDPIGMALRRLHDAVANEPIPADMMVLIAEIDAKIQNDAQNSAI